MNSKLLAAVVVILAVAFVGFVIATRPFTHRFLVKAYFTDVSGLRECAPVRLAGMDVGSVRSIRLTGDIKTPVEVVMSLTPAWAKKIPSDSTVVLSTAGVLGETYISIDSTNASGPIVQTNSVLKVKPSVQMSMPEMMDKFVQALTKKCPCVADLDAATGQSKSRKISHTSVSKHGSISP